MEELPKHRHFGIPIDEWASRIPNELTQDAVGLWQIVPCFIHDFGLQGAALEQYVRASIEQLIAKGAVPVQAPGTNSVRQDLLGSKGPDIDKVMAYLSELGHEPTVDDVWFELPHSGP